MQEPEEQGGDGLRQLATAGFSSVAVLLLTIAHHLSGASLYRTPWRGHMAHLRAIGIVVMVTLVVLIAGVGLFEGGSSHVMKNALSVGGLPRDLMLTLFPPPTYALFDDLIFEVTGILQFVMALVAMRAWHRLVRARTGSGPAAHGKAVALAAALAAVPSGGAVAGPDLYAASAMQPVRNPVPAPAFVLHTLEGRPLESSSLRGKVVVVNFWATWCVPCKEEMPSLERLKQRFKPDEFELLAVTTDQQRETIKRFLEALRLTFPVLIDDSKDVSAAFGVRGLPTTVLIGKGGHIVARAVGPRAWDSPETVALIRSLMEQKP